MRFLGLILTIFILCSDPSFADVYEHPAKLETVMQELPKLSNIKCKFKQEKTIQNLQNPLISKGDFEFIENEGVFFHTTYPIESKTDYTNQNYRQINEIINAISTKKYARLEKEFDFFFTGVPTNWYLGLKPKQTCKAKDFISSITIVGNNYIQEIKILQTNGNRTTLWFTK